MSTALQWFKSSYSSEQGGACLEVAYSWFKSSYSSEQGGQCLEVATSPRTIHIRDSKHLAGPALAVTRDTWTAFLTLAQR
ncbi:DUF397 domain-containing protein [Streptomyces fulvoviolaceus]|uniref:DUF397 domain-containing protein n=1 Tax=Streptomyces fulvoviolaceus TaxID=285535 RepID=UPI0004CBFF10|nr:DUF397 domain-containing protein [Streptomyces fulvoviolaceus]